ncbi:Uncharacterised protein [Myroides odoratimimus]|nr:Uncharacterised protein [Myroides odoratimimus]
MFFKLYTFNFLLKNHFKKALKRYLKDNCKTYFTILQQRKFIYRLKTLNGILRLLLALYCQIVGDLLI